MATENWRSLASGQDIKPFLDFYRDRKIIPVSQKDALTATHTGRRNALYRSLGITRNCVQDRSALEFGPGTGDNALHTASWQPDRMLLVDGNPHSIEAVRKKIKAGLLGSNCEALESEFLAFQSDEKFDLVICEAAIPGQSEPEKYLCHIASFVRPYGLLSTTAIGSVSYLAEICRRALVPLIIRETQDWDEAVKRLSAFFKPDLDSLTGMSRPHDDWVMDNLLNPWFPDGLFGADRVIRCLADKFEILGMSPRILQDWRWYKDISADSKVNAEYAIAEYRKWSTYLIDYRLKPVTPQDGLAEELEVLTDECMLAEAMIQKEASAVAFDRLAAALDKVSACLTPEFEATSRSICDFVSGMRELQGGQRDCDFGTFRTWFGRGQQYLSFVRAS